MITQKKTARKPQATFPTSVDDLFRQNPLPKHWRHLESFIRSLPFESFLSVCAAGIQFHLSDATLQSAIVQAAKFYRQTSFRCCACFTYTAIEETFVIAAADGKFTFGALCPRCKGLINAGRETPSMQSNMAAYLRGEE